MTGILNIGMNSLLAYQLALTTTAQNIANVDTKFYSRRQVNFSEVLMNGGVQVADVRRIFDEAASQNVQVATSKLANMDVYLQQLQHVESILSDNPGSSNSIKKFINDSLKALAQLNTNPADSDSRNNFLKTLGNLSNRFKDINGQIQLQLQNVNQSLTSNVAKVNTITKQIAALNELISNSGEGEISGLLDQRLASQQELAELIDFSTQTDSQGQINIYVGNGLSLVSGSRSYDMDMVTDPANPTNLMIVIPHVGPNVSVNNFITEGSIAGLLATRTQGLEQAQRALGQLSLALSDQFNRQNKLGADYNGNLGGNIFNDINSSSAINNRVLANLNNTSSALMSVVIDDTTQITADNYLLDIDAPNHYVLTRLSNSGNVVVSSGAISSFPQTISVDGFSLNINSGTVTQGDLYTISPTRLATSNMSLVFADPKLLALAIPVVAEKNILNTGNGNISVTQVVDTTNAAFSTPNQLNPPILVRFTSDTTYELVNANDNSIIETGLTYTPPKSDIFPTPGSYDPGYRIALEGQIKAGDTFNIKYNATPSGDAGNGKLMEELYQAKTVAGLTFGEGYHALANSISIETNSAQTGYESGKLLLSQALIRYDGYSGVSFENEVVNLASYQQAYQASAQILDTARSLFDTIIMLVQRR